MRAILTAESVTALDVRARGAVLVAGSHGGRIAGWYAAEAGVHAVILNDAGVGLDGAGIAALADLDACGMAAATAAHDSARIGDGADMLARGRISHANATAMACGVSAGQTVRDAAVRLTVAPAPRGAPLRETQGRWRFAEGTCEVWGLDSIGLVEEQDVGRVLIIGSHGALHGGRAASALEVAARAAIFNDAGMGIEGVGVTRLPVLGARGIPAATVDGASARIGDARSMWATGILSCVNGPAETAGARPGESVQAFVTRLISTDGSTPAAAQEKTATD